MVTVCIWTLHDAMRTVHKTFQIPAYGTKHTSPAINDEIAAIAQALDNERIQTYMKNCPGSDANDGVAPVHDLVAHGVQYFNSWRAYPKFTPEQCRARNIGQAESPDQSEDEDETEDVEVLDADQEPDIMPDNLELDDDEHHDMVDNILSSTHSLADDIIDS